MASHPDVLHVHVLSLLEVGIKKPKERMRTSTVFAFHCPLARCCCLGGARDDPPRAPILHALATKLASIAIVTQGNGTVEAESAFREWL